MSALVLTSNALGQTLSFWPFSRRSARKPLLIAGTGTMFTLNEALANAYSRMHPDVDIVVERGGAMSALIALKRRSIDVAASDHELKPQEDEKGLRSFLVARNGVGVLVNQGLGMRNLSAKQIQGIVSGHITHWSQVGGPNAKIQVVTRATGTPARKFIEDMLLEGADFAGEYQERHTPQEVMSAVAQDRYTIGFVLLKDRESTPQISFISVDGVAATRETLLSNRYPFTQSLYFNVIGDAASEASLFVDFARSEAGQRIVDAQLLVGTY
jgi:phosphate transport system substrate-binding protein